jgi:outer membrane protein assembly factor BamA
VFTHGSIATTASFCIVAVLSSSREAAPSDAFPDRFEFVLGDLRPGAGISLGFDYAHTHFASGAFDLKVGSRISHRLYQRHEMEVALPHLAHERLFAEVLALYRSYTEIDYFGVGPGSPEESHSDYHISGPALFATFGFRPARKAAFGARAGLLESNLDSGRNGSLPSIEETFPVRDLPGLVEEPDFFLWGGFALLDRRDDPEDATSGAFYEVQATAYRDRGLNRFDFEELSVDARHYVPLRPRWTVATRVTGVLTRAAEGQEIPFFLLPSLGGAGSLHAFENDRFRDRNLLLMNVELRYALTPSIRLVGFVDAGEVFPDFGSFRLGGLELSSGLGARYKLAGRVLVGVSLAAGREGMRAAMSGSFRF